MYQSLCVSRRTLSGTYLPPNHLTSILCELATQADVLCCHSGGVVTRRACLCPGVLISRRCLRNTQLEAGGVFCCWACGHKCERRWIYWNINHTGLERYVRLPIHVRLARDPSERWPGRLLMHQISCEFHCARDRASKRLLCGLSALRTSRAPSCYPGLPCDAQPILWVAKSD